MNSIFEDENYLGGNLTELPINVFENFIFRKKFLGSNGKCLLKCLCTLIFHLKIYDRINREAWKKWEKYLRYKFDLSRDDDIWEFLDSQIDIFNKKIIIRKYRNRIPTKEDLERFIDMYKIPILIKDKLINIDDFKNEYKNSTFKPNILIFDKMILQGKDKINISIGEFHSIIPIQIVSTNIWVVDPEISSRVFTPIHLASLMNAAQDIGSNGSQKHYLTIYEIKFKSRIYRIPRPQINYIPLDQFIGGT